MPYAKFRVQAVDTEGNALTDVSVEVRRETTDAVTAIYSGREGGALANPFVAASGKAEFYAPGGAYKIILTKGTFSETLRYEAVGTSQETDVGEINFAGASFNSEAETESPPSVNSIRSNDEDLSAASELYISDVALNGHSLAAYLLSLAPASSNTKNELTIVDVSTGASCTFMIDGTTDETGFTTLAVSGHSGTTSLSTGTVKLTFSKAGARGAAGAAATITVGTVSSVPATNAPTVTNSGNTSAAVFDFEIPKGEGLDFDVQVDELSDLSTYDSEAEGFRVLVSDVGDGRAAIYSRVTGTPGTWSDPAYLGGGSISLGDSILTNSYLN